MSVPLLHEAIAGKNADKIRELLAQGDCDVNVVDDNDRTALFVAASCGDVATVKLLLALGADPQRAQINGVTPLLAALNSEHVDVVAALLAAGAAPNTEDAYGRRPLTVAADCGDVTLVNLLLDAGADVNGADGGGRTALLAAAADKNVAVVRTLLAAGASVDKCLACGTSALHLAAGLPLLKGRSENDRETIVTELIAASGPAGALRHGTQLARDIWTRQRGSPASYDVAVAAGTALRAATVAAREAAALAHVTIHATTRPAPPPNVVVGTLAALRLAV